MTAPTHVLAIDQGTTSSRAIVFRDDFSIAGMAQAELPQHYPRSGWVEHDPEDIWRTALATARQALASAGLGARDLAALGITNQRETTILWDRETGQPVYPAIVWQDRRTAEACGTLEAAGHGAAVTAATGLRLDPYFSATKIAWILDEVPGARPRAEQGKLAFGTVDSFLLWRLTGGALHATDITNASRTLLFDIHAKAWSRPLLELFRIPESVLPDVRDNDAEFATTIAAHLGAAVPITGMAGDQQAALIGQACFTPGMMKSTYGTGCFAVLNTGAEPVVSRNRMLTTIGYSIGGRTTYALEGSIFVAGAAVQWLRDGLGIITSAGETAAMADAADPDQDVILVPAFVGLGAPYWDAEARGALFGLTRATGPNELARAALESVCFQTADLLDAMHRDVGHPDTGGGDTVLRVDGGLAASEWTMQRLADLTGAVVDRPAVLETTALGAAYLAGFKAGIYPPPERFAELWARDRRYMPAITAAQRDKRLAAWRAAVSRTLSVK